MLCINENVNRLSRKSPKYVYQEPLKNEWMLPASILGAGGIIGGGLYYLSKKQSGGGPSSDEIFGIKIDPSIPLNADKW